MAVMNNTRVIRDIANVERGTNLAFAVGYKESDMSEVRALIIGAPGTPYELGFFEFTVVFPRDYPQNPPKVMAETTDGGNTRFNPNIYATGKVCLSTLGTWPGEAGEQWSPAQSLETVLLSIQSLMSDNPYVNEPGFETDHDKEEATSYCAKIAHETLRISVLKRLEDHFGIVIKQGRSEERASSRSFLPLKATKVTEEEDTWQPFISLIKTRFLWYYASYKNIIDAATRIHGTLVAEGKPFPKMPFEGQGNEMRGQFQYASLRKRLHDVRAALDAERDRWIEEGAAALKRENPLALSMQNEFRSMPQKLRECGTTVDFEMVDDNPFVWRVVVFGKPMSNLDGGVFKVLFVWPLAWPEESPRVTVETPLFHHKISPDGVLCYQPKKPAEYRSHVECAIEAIVGETTCSDAFQSPNPEASALLWGGPEQKKVYNRKLRRSAQESTEYA